MPWFLISKRAQGGHSLCYDADVEREMIMQPNLNYVSERRERERGFDWKAVLKKSPRLLHLSVPVGS